MKIYKKNIRVLLSIAVFTAIFSYLFINNISVSHGNDLIWLLVFHPILFLLTVGLVVRDYFKFGYWFNLSNFVLLLIYLYFGIGSLYYVIFYNYLPHETLKYSDYAITTFWIVCLAVTSYRIGSILPVTNYISMIFPIKRKTPVLSNRIRLGIIFSLLISLGTKLYLILVGNFGFMTSNDSGSFSSGLLTIINLIDLIGLTGIMVGFYYWFSKNGVRKLDKFIMIIAVILFLLFALMYGMKAKVLYVLLSIIIPSIFVERIQNRKTLSLKVYLMVLILFFSYWIVNPVVRLLMVESKTDDIAQAVFTTIDAIGSIDSLVRGDDDLLFTGVHTIWERVSLFRYLNSVVAQGGNSGNDFRNFDRYPFLLVTFLPRSLIPEKPINNYSAQFNLDYISDVKNSTTPSMIGWAYMETGVFSVIILMFALGILHGSIDKYCIKHGNLSVFSMVVFTVFFIKIANIEPDPYWIFSGLFQELLLIILCYFILFARVKNR